jgi:fatty acid desaturase
MSKDIAANRIKIFDFITLPPIAWPTIALTVCGAFLQFVVAVALHSNHLTSATACLLSSIAIFVLFTPMHDAVHGSIATSDSGWVCWFSYDWFFLWCYSRLTDVDQNSLNDIIGWICSWSFPAPYAAFKYCHLQHHAHTNETDGSDPDLWVARGPWFVLPIRWATIECSYYSYYLPLLLRGQRPRKESIQALLQLVAQVYVVLYGLKHYWTLAIFVWLLPGRIALTLLAFTFDYLPHRPHAATRAQDPFKATAVTSLVGSITWPLTWPLLHQNYHIVHHLWPFLPFYQYSRAWFCTKDELLRSGTSVIPMFGSYTAPKKLN